MVRCSGTGHKFFGVRDDGTYYERYEFPSGTNVCSVLDCGSVQGTEVCRDCGKTCCFVHAIDHPCEVIPLWSSNSPPGETGSGGDDLGQTLLEPGSPTSVVSLGSDSSGQSLGSVNSLGPFPPTDLRDFVTVDPGHPSFGELGPSGSQTTPLDSTGTVGSGLATTSAEDVNPSVFSEVGHSSGDPSLGPYPTLSLSGHHLLILVDTLSSDRGTFGSDACSGPPVVGGLDLPEGETPTLPQSLLGILQEISVEGVGTGVFNSLVHDPDINNTDQQAQTGEEGFLTPLSPDSSHSDSGDAEPRLDARTGTGTGPEDEMEGESEGNTQPRDIINPDSQHQNTPGVPLLPEKGKKTSCPPSEPRPTGGVSPVRGSPQKSTVETSTPSTRPHRRRERPDFNSLSPSEKERLTITAISESKHESASVGLTVLNVPKRHPAFVVGNLAFGTYATRKFKKGDYIVSAKGEVLTRAAKELRYPPGTHPQYLLDKEGDGTIFIDQSYPLGTNAVRFINHFKGVRDARGKIVGQTVEYLPGGQVRASRTIEKGEELLADYGPDYYFDPRGTVQEGGLVQAQIWLEVESERDSTSPGSGSEEAALPGSPVRETPPSTSEVNAPPQAEGVQEQ